jgi:hypothetical protein
MQYEVGQSAIADADPTPHLNHKISDTNHGTWTAVPLKTLLLLSNHSFNSRLPK